MRTSEVTRRLRHVAVAAELSTAAIWDAARLCGADADPQAYAATIAAALAVPTPACPSTRASPSW